MYTDQQFYHSRHSTTTHTFSFKLGLADGHLHNQELAEIKRIARHLRINSYDFASIEAMFHKNQDADWAFKVLEVPNTATEPEVKRAYRKMAMKFHPDRLVDAGADAQAAARRKAS